MAWDFNVNIAVSEASALNASRYSIVAFKDYLLSKGWTCVLSSDGTANFGAANYWPTLGGAYTTLANLAWITLRAPIGTTEMSLQFGIDGSYARWDQLWSIDAPMDGTYTLTSRPGSITSFRLVGLPSATSSASDGYYMTYSTSYTLHLLYNTTTYEMIFAAVKSGKAVTFMGLLAYTSSDGVMRYAGVKSGSKTSVAADTLTFANYRTSLTDKVRGAVEIPMLTRGVLSYESRIGIVSLGVGGVWVDAVLPRDPIDNSVVEFPCYINAPGGTGHVYGPIDTLRGISSAAAVTGDKLSDQATGDRFVFGTFTIPWNNS